MEDDPGKARGHGRPTSESLKKGERRPGDSLPVSAQPRYKIAKKTHSSSPEEGGSGGSSSSREKSSDRERKREPESLPGPSTSRQPSAPERRSEAGGDAPRGISSEQGGRERRRGYEIINTRPSNIQTKCGSSGDQIPLQGNYFRLLKKPSWQIYQYRVDFLPEIEMARVRRGILSQHKSVFGGYIFDGTIIFTTTKLKDDLTTLDAKSREDVDYKITVKFVGVISMKQGQALQVLNLILRRAMAGLQLQLVGRNFFDPKAKIEVRQYALQLWPGYITSIRQHENDVLLCTEIAHKVMRTETVYDILQKCISDGRNGYQDEFKRQVLGLTVLTDYNNNTYRIDDVDFALNPRSTFNQKETPVSFVDYYYTKYHIRIRDLNQPLLISKPKEKQRGNKEAQTIVLVPELCRATGLSESMRSNFQLTRALSEHTRLNPDRRIDRLKTFNRRLAETESSMTFLKQWQMSLDSQLVEIPGRVLKCENIVFGSGKKVPAGDRADWTNHFRNSSMYTSVELTRWTFICTKRIQNDVRGFIDCLIQAARGMRMNIRPPSIEPIYDDRNHSYINAIDQATSRDVQLIMCVVPNNNSERYGSIKKKTCVERPVPTQVMCQRNVLPKGGNPRSLMSVATKVAIQMNCKLGGAPWMIELPLTGLMTIGYDMCRCTRDKSRSYSALVATMDLKSHVKYFSCVSKGLSCDSLSNELSISVGKALREYGALHGTLPSRILFYRDGVGDGQIHQVLEHEVNVVAERLKSIYRSAKIETQPRFAFVIVSKQINTRLFSRGRNPPPGTIADSVITLPERYDFFLVSQSVGQGTVSPTSYNVVYDTMGLPPDKMQMLTYKMTHLYYNWSGTLRVPAVCQYAKKLATLVAQSIHQEPVNLLEKQLYFL